MQRIRNLAIIIVLPFLAGCVTPQEVKQAVVNIDKGYSDNQKLMGQYQKIVANIHGRQKQLHRYVQQRLMLSDALRITTTNVSLKKKVVDEKFTRFGIDLTNLINELRLSGLPEVNGEDGTVFVQGKAKNTTDQIIARLPELIHLVGKRVDTNYENQRYQKDPDTGEVKLDEQGEKIKKASFNDMKHFEIYKSNVQALRQINNSIKRYLDIDITVSSEDIREIATGYRELQQ
jgi:hypothetical protein